MQPTVTIDTKEFNAALRALFATDKRSCVDFINGQSLRVSIEAVRQTEKASAAKIETELGVVSRGFTYVKKGKNIGKLRLTTKNLGAKSLAEKILWKRFRKTKRFGLRGATNIKDAVKKLLASRARSISFIRAGWIPVRNKLFTIVKQKPTGLIRLDGAKQYGDPKGRVAPANEGQGSVATCTMVNLSMNPKHQTGNPMPVAVRGLQKALNFVAADMMNKLAERLSRDLKPFNAKK
jgi:hypothetical protein